MKIKIAIVLSIALTVFLLRDYLNIDALLSLVEALRANPFAPIIFVFIYAIAVTFVVPASALTLISAPLFGFWLGLLVTIIGSNLGCHLSYWIAKILGEDAIKKRIKSGSFIDNAKEKATKNGFIFMMYVRLIPLFPFAAINYLSGIIGIKYRDYSIATVLGMLPGSAVYVYLGYTAANVKDNPLGIVISISVLVVFTIIVTLVKKKTEAKKTEEKI